MRRDVCYFFATDVKSLYNAYLAAASNDRFRRECGQEPYHTLTFGLNFSMKYNFNGGSCHLRFIPCTGGSAVNMRFTLAQAMGARYENYARDLSEEVTGLLGIPAQPSNIDVEVFMRPELQVTAAPMPAPAPAPVASLFCTECGKPLGSGDRFCSSCGKPVTPPAPHCPRCGKTLKAEDAFCSACGTALK